MRFCSQIFTETGYIHAPNIWLYEKGDTEPLSECKGTKNSGTSKFRNFFENSGYKSTSEISLSEKGKPRLIITGGHDPPGFRR